METVETGVAGKPVGVGLSVAFVWALAGQMFTTVVFEVLFGTSGLTAHVPNGKAIFFAVGYLIATAILIVIGEALRSGRLWSWWFILVLSGGLSLGGLVMIPSTITSLQQHDGWPLWPQAILLTLVPFVFYRMMQPQTRQWYGHVSVDAARARHNKPLWLATIISCAVIGGFLTALFQRLG